MSEPFFPIERIPFGGPDGDDPLAFRCYEPDRVVAGKRMEEHLRFAVCYWHTFCWPGSDVFGDGTFARPWLAEGDATAKAERKLAVAFEFFEKLGVHNDVELTRLAMRYDMLDDAKGQSTVS